MNRVLKSIMVFAVMTALFVTGAVSAYAEGVENPHIEVIGHVSILNGASPVIFRDTSTGSPAYCIDYNRGIPDPESLSGEFDPMTIFDPDTYQGLEYLLLAGFPFETGGLTDDEAQACTQLAVWCWTYETLGYGIDASSFSAIPGRENVYDYFVGLMETARNQTSPDIGISCEGVEMLVYGDVLTGQTTVTLRNLQNYSIDESVLPDGIAISGFTGNDGDVLTFTAPLSYEGQSIQIVELLIGQDTRSALNLFWYDNSNPNQQRMVISYLDETTIAITAGLSLTFEDMPEPQYGFVKVIKTATPTELPLEGVVFGVYNADGEKVYELTTGADGTATSEALDFGEYELCELATAEGYVLLESPIPLTVSEHDVTVEISVNNEPITGSIKILKTDDTGNTLVGAVFGIFDEIDLKVGEMVTSGAGLAVYDNLPYGSYYMKELVAPEGYILLTDPIPFVIKIQGEMVELSFINTKEPVPVGKMRLIKMDDDTSKRLKDAVFGVYNASTDEKVCELTTNANGEAVTLDLPVGDYYLKELTAPVGYELRTDKISVMVKDGETVMVTVTNKMIPKPPAVGKITLIKKADGTNKKLSDAIFGVYKSSNDEKVCELKTGTDGKATSPDLPVGDYYLKEIKAPTGYLLDNDKISVTVKDGEMVEVTVINYPEPIPTPDPEPKEGKITLIKKADNTGKKLSGAVFGIYKVSNDVKVCELKTGTDGKATSPYLPVADYYLKEIKAPTGYLLGTDKISVTIKDGETVEVTVINYLEPDSTPEPNPDPTYGRIMLIKKDADTRKLLKDAIFGVYKVSNDVKVCELKTGTDGEAVSPLLPAGDYYLKEIIAPIEYELSSEKYGVTVKADKTVEIVITNVKKPDPTPTPTPTPLPTPKPTPTPTPKPTQPPVVKPTPKGELLIIKKAEQTGKPLYGAVFGVYNAANDTKLSELSTNTDGKATLSLSPGKYYLKELKAPYGYMLETVRIYLTVTVDTTVTVEVTNIRDEEIIDPDVPLGGIDIPKTGEDFPTGNYVVGFFLIAVTLMCGIKLFYGRRLKNV